MGSAIFFDLVKDKTINGFDPANVITLMTSPMSGTLVPAASGRTEVQGIGVQSYPIGWFTQSNFGGRFSPMLKFAGWDGIVLEGKADRPVWIDVRNDRVKIRDAGRLWGKDTWETQKVIHNTVMGGPGFGDWMVGAYGQIGLLAPVLHPVLEAIHAVLRSALAGYNKCLRAGKGRLNR